MPGVVLTTEAAGDVISSIGLLKKGQNSDDDSLYKIFSRVQLSQEMLQRFFIRVSDVHRKSWKAYPKFNVPENFAPFDLDERKQTSV